MRVARRARLHYSERKEWTRERERERGGGRDRRKEDGNCVSDSREIKWREKRKKNDWKRDEERPTLNVDVVVDNAGDYRRIHISRVI